jgi:hypothetical protein
MVPISSLCAASNRGMSVKRCTHGSVLASCRGPSADVPGVYAPHVADAAGHTISVSHSSVSHKCVTLQVCHTAVAPILLVDILTSSMIHLGPPDHCACRGIDINQPRVAAARKCSPTRVPQSPAPAGTRPRIPPRQRPSSGGSGSPGPRYSPGTAPIPSRE